MSAVSPRIVETDDARRRRDAAMAVTKAYLTAPHALIPAIATAAAVAAMAVPPTPSWSVLTLTAVLAALWFFGAFAITFFITTYRTPRSRHQQLAYVRTTTGAQAAAQLRPGGRRGREPGMLLVAGLGAWPKRKGAGAELGEWIRQYAHEQGMRVTLTATPLLAPMYRRHGLVNDGTTAKFLVRLSEQEGDG